MNFHTGWPPKNATLKINNFKKTRDRMKKLCALSRIKFFSQQDDTKNAKVTIYGMKIFHCLASPGKLSALAL